MKKNFKALATLTLYTSFYLISFSLPLIIAAQGKMYTVVPKIYVNCPDSKDPRNAPDEVKVEVYLNNQPIRGTGGLFQEGNYSLRVNLYEREGFEGKFDPFYIREVQWMRCNAGNDESPIQRIKPLDRHATMNVSIPPDQDPKSCYRIVVMVDKCADVYQGEAKVQVVATVSTTPGGKSVPVDDMLVQIGDKPVSFSSDGKGIVKIRANKYKMSYSHNGNENGSIDIRTTATGNTQMLGSSLRPGSNGVYEATIVLSEEFIKPNYVYDYEIRINMINPQKPCSDCNVRVVGVVPGVMVHRAGTPEESWEVLIPDMELKAGDEISCDPDGSVVLQFPSGTTTVVKNTTQLKIASFFSEGGIERTEYLLRRGEILQKVPLPYSPKSDQRIVSPTDVSSIRGTVYSRSYDPLTQTSTTRVEEGIVEIKPVNTSLKTIVVKAGQQVSVTNNKVNDIIPFSEKLDFSLKKEKKEQSLTDHNVSGVWKVKQDNYTGTLTLVQSGTSLTGTLTWSNHQKGSVEYGILVGTTIMFTIAYEGDLKGNYTATLSADGKQMLEGSGISNKGTSAVWSAVKQ